MENQENKPQLPVNSSGIKYLGAAVVLIILGAFYWFEYRPSQAIKSCTKLMNDRIDEFQKNPPVTNSLTGGYTVTGGKRYPVDAERWYKNCMLEKGIDE